jgi:hypothetical protein
MARTVARLNRKQRPKFRQRGRLLVPAYRFVKNPGKPCLNGQEEIAAPPTSDWR